MPPLRNMWKYYPNRKGLFTGFVLCGFGFSAIILNQISNRIINPDHIRIDNYTQFYPAHIGNRVPNYFFIASIVIISFGLFGSLFIFEYEKDEIDEIDSNPENMASDLIVNKDFNLI